MMFFQKNKPTAVDIGRFGEAAAEQFLKKSGYRILAKNFRAGRNELDIVAENREFLVFVEVKARSNVGAYEYDYGTPSTAVTHAKRKRTVEAARAYLCKNPTDKTPRFDVIEVIGEGFGRKIRHIENAFEDV